MDSADINGGNAEVACESSNLETVEQPEKQPEDPEEPMEGVLEVEQEINGDLQDASKSSSSPPRRNLRKSKANSTSTIESDAKPKMKGRKRKLSGPDISSEESTDFNGFDSHCFNSSEAGNLVLQKLIGN